MSSHTSEPHSLAANARHEAIEFAAIFAYLYACLGMFVLNKHLALATAQVAYAPYGFALAKAAILAKFIMLIQHFVDGRKYLRRPLVWSTLGMALAFTVLLILLSVVEEVVLGLIHKHSAYDTLVEAVTVNLLGIVSTSMVILVALVPYFAFRQLSHVIGPGYLVQLFFTGGPKAEALRGFGRTRDAAAGDTTAR